MKFNNLEKIFWKWKSFLRILMTLVQFGFSLDIVFNTFYVVTWTGINKGVYLIFFTLWIIFGNRLIPFSENSKKERNGILTNNCHSLLLKLTNALFEHKVQTEIFEPIVFDWQKDYFEALFKKEIWKVRWINVRYTYAFLAAMWLKSPIGDLIEFIRKIAK